MMHDRYLTDDERSPMYGERLSEHLWDDEPDPTCPGCGESGTCVCDGCPKDHEWTDEDMECGTCGARRWTP
jgi:hypothetical protein